MAVIGRPKQAKDRELIEQKKRECDDYERRAAVTEIAAG
jgi:hypothetical protein